MKVLGKLIGDLMTWRWAPAVGLCVASLFYVLVVVALVPEEIGVPVTNARFAQKVAPAKAEEPELPTYPTTVPESEMAPPPPAPVQPAGVVDFGRRGFSPPLERPEAPPPPVMPQAVAPPPPPVAAVVPPPAPEPPAAPEAAVAAASAAALEPGTPIHPNAQPPGPNTPRAGIMRSMQAFRGGMFPTPSGTPPGQQPPPEAPPAAPPGQ